MGLLTSAFEPLVNNGNDAVTELNTGAAVNVDTPVTPSVPLSVWLAPAIVPVIVGLEMVGLEMVGLVMVGLALITPLPVPVMGFDTNTFEAFVNTACDGESPVYVTAPETVITEIFRVFVPSDNPLIKSVKFWFTWVASEVVPLVNIYVQLGKAIFKSLFLNYI